jgi:chaperonin GroEL
MRRHREGIMAHKRLRFHAEAREKVLRGAQALADAVRVTLGPKSKSVLIERKYGRPLVCNDGVTIVKELTLEDPEENLGVQVLRQAAERTGDLVGDGTTTSTLLACAIFAAGVRNVAAGASAVDIKRGIERAARIAVASIKQQSRPVTSKQEKVQVAAVAAHNDTSIGEIVADAVERVGSEGVVTVEEAKGTETALEVVEGMQFDRGFLSPYFVTDPERMEAVLDEAIVLIVDRRIASMQELLPLLEQIVKAGRPLCLVAEDLEGDALATLVLNRIRGVLPCVAVKAPGFGDRRKAMLQDLATVVGGRVISSDLGTKLESVTLADLGSAHRVVVGKDTTTIVGGSGMRDAIAARVRELTRQIADTTSDYDREKLQERAARLAGGVAVVRVGASSETELKTRKEAFDDAVSATKAAVAEGIVPGAGLAYLRAIDAVEREMASSRGDEQTGMTILRHALEVPTRQIAENSGADDGVVVDRMRRESGALGFDASRGEYGDLIQLGIVDATKVVRLALENAVSVAGTLLLTEATLTDLPERKGETATSAEAA